MKFVVLEGIPLPASGMGLSAQGWTTEGLSRCASCCLLPGLPLMADLNVII